MIGAGADAQKPSAAWRSCPSEPPSARAWHPSTRGTCASSSAGSGAGDRRCGRWRCVGRRHRDGTGLRRRADEHRPRRRRRPVHMALAVRQGVSASRHAFLADTHVPPPRIPGQPASSPVEGVIGPEQVDWRRVSTSTPGNLDSRRESRFLEPEQFKR